MEFYKKQCLLQVETNCIPFLWLVKRLLEVVLLTCCISVSIPWKVAEVLQKRLKVCFCNNTIGYTAQNKKVIFILVQS